MTRWILIPLFTLLFSSLSYGYDQGDRIQTNLCPKAGDSFKLYKPPVGLLQFSMDYVLSCTSSAEYYFLKSMENERFEVVGKVHKSLPGGLFFRADELRGESSFIQNNYDIYTFYFAEGPNCPDHLELHSNMASLDPNTFALSFDSGQALGICSNWKKDQYAYYPRLVNFLDINDNSFQDDGRLEALIYVEDPNNRPDRQLLWIHWDVNAKKATFKARFGQGHLYQDCGREFVTARFLPGYANRIILFDMQPGFQILQLEGTNKVSQLEGIADKHYQGRGRSCIFPSPNFNSLRPGKDTLGSFQTVSGSPAFQLDFYSVSLFPHYSVHYNYWESCVDQAYIKPGGIAEMTLLGSTRSNCRIRPPRNEPRPVPAPTDPNDGSGGKDDGIDVKIPI